jgi:YggT family protein
LLEIVFMLVNTVAGVLGTALLLRAYMLWNGISAFNPLGQFAYALTDWLVMPLRRLVPLPGRIDWPSLLAAYLVALAALALLGLITGSLTLASDGASALPVLALLILLRWAMYLVIGLTVLYALLSWINPRAPLAPVTNALVRPMLAPFRRFIPLIGGVDLSPLALILLANIVLVIVGSIAR